ncbi:MAG: preprotein translocase subunit SecG [Clostridia bacterium]|nr:preprotein translocase subunit SecG [Clostridia bacterium]
MQPIEWILGIILMVLAVFLVVAVLLQSGKDKRLSGTITGGSETYYGKNKGRSWDKILARATTVIAIVFAVVAVAMYVVVAAIY